MSLGESSTDDSDEDISGKSNQSENDSIYDTDDEVDPEVIPVNLSPTMGQTVPDGEPIQMDVNLARDDMSSFVPLCLMMNCRSAYNKENNLNEIIRQISPDLILASETWERKRKLLNEIIKNKNFKIVSYYRKNKSPGGGSAIIFNENRFRATDPEVSVPENVEAVWSIFSPVAGCTQQLKVKRIAVASIYVSPRSQHKSETIDHIIETIHILRAKYDNEINFCIGGDLNHLPIADILECYGGLKQIVSVCTRMSATLSVVLTDLHSFFHPPTTLPPLQVDEDKKGEDSDHNIVVLAPKSNAQYKINRVKKTIRTRPIPESQLINFEKDLANFPWSDVFEGKNPNEQTRIFHNFLRSQLDQYFPEKTTQISNLDRKWFSPALKQIHRKLQREFYSNRKSPKYKRLKCKFKHMKRKAVKSYYSDFVLELKQSDPAKWYKMAKKIGAVDQMTGGDTQVECLTGYDNYQSAQIIANHFAHISNEYEPVDNAQLPCYLPPN